MASGANTAIRSPIAGTPVRSVPADPPENLAAEASAEPADVVVGLVGRPFGRRGEVHVEPLTDAPGRFLELDRVETGAPGGPGVERRIAGARLHRNRLVVALSGASTIDDAEALRGCEIRIRESDRAPLPEDHAYHDDLIGCAVHAPDGTALGEVTDIHEIPGRALLLVRSRDGEENLIPFVEAICTDVDVRARRIVASPPEGLMGLNRSDPGSASP